MIGRPMRSFTEPPGLKNSAFAYTGVRTPRVTRWSRMSGVHPIVSRTDSYGVRLRSTVTLMLRPFFQDRIARKRRGSRISEIDGKENGHRLRLAARFRRHEP